MEYEELRIRLIPLEKSISYADGTFFIHSGGRSYAYADLQTIPDFMSDLREAAERSRKPPEQCVTVNRILAFHMLPCIWIINYSGEEFSAPVEPDWIAETLPLFEKAAQLASRNPREKFRIRLLSDQKIINVYSHDD